MPLSSMHNNCATHGLSRTPHLDYQLTQPKTVAILQTLGSKLSHSSQCTQCATETLATSLADYVKGLREAKKNGELSKEQRKELKMEVKFLFKSVKKDVKTIWKK
jgi:hypothetical protein